jgi:hypothetical protein
MAERLEQGAALALVGFCGFQLWDAWNKTAPSLADCRGAAPGDVVVGQQLMDADVTVGSLAVLIGVIMAILSKNATALIIILVMFGGLSFWHHMAYRGLSPEEIRTR